MDRLSSGHLFYGGQIISDASEKETKLRTDSLISRMNLEGVKERLPSQISGGEAQRAAVARAVINKPTIVFADEPIGALIRQIRQKQIDCLGYLVYVLEKQAGKNI